MRTKYVTEPFNKTAHIAGLLNELLAVKSRENSLHVFTFLRALKLAQTL